LNSKLPNEREEISLISFASPVAQLIVGTEGTENHEHGKNL
jgi:hypothetical protein